MGWEDMIRGLLNKLHFKSTIEHHNLVTLWVLIEELFESGNFILLFLGLKKSFNIVSYEHLWWHIKEYVIPSAYVCALICIQIDLVSCS